MKLTAGYQIQEDDRFMRTLLEHRDRITEIYFSWPGIANGRNSTMVKLGLSEWEAERVQRQDLHTLADAGMEMNLLLNGNCYGGESLARSFYQKLGNTVDMLSGEFSLQSVTTTSPVIARFLKQNFPGLEIRASVNMEIGTQEGVEYLADVFDSFYLKRELNRNIGKVKELAEFCHRLGKKAFLLANSGCLNYCSARTFHDNLVSHEAECAKMDNAYRFDGVCRNFLTEAEKRSWIIRYSNWIRPQDLEHYEGVVDGIKLATRVSDSPELIVQAYTAGKFSGNMLSLTEPDFSAMFWPAVLPPSRFPDDYFERMSRCARECRHCGYCHEVYEKAVTVLNENVFL